MAKWKNGIRKPDEKDHNTMVDQMIKLFGLPTGWNCPDNAIGTMLMFKPKNKAYEDVKALLKENYGTPKNEDKKWFCATVWPIATDWEVEKTTLRLFKSGKGPRACQIAIGPY